MMEFGIFDHMLDQLSEGRLELGIGRGVSSLEVKFYNVDADRTRAMFDEALEVLRRGLTQPVLDFTGEFYDYDTVPMELTPVQRPLPPIWYPTSSMSSVPWVARNGFNTVFAGGPDHIAGQVRGYLDNLDPALRGRARYGLHPFIVVAPTDEEAMRVGAAAYRAHHENLSYLRSWSGRGGQLTRTQNLGAPDTLKEAVAAGWAAAGSPDSVRGQLSEILGKTGCNYLLYTPISGNTPVTFALRALDLFADKVLPGLLTPTPRDGLVEVRADISAIGGAVGPLHLLDGAAAGDQVGEAGAVGLPVRERLGHRDVIAPVERAKEDDAGLVLPAVVDPVERDRGVAVAGRGHGAERGEVHLDVVRGFLLLRRVELDVREVRDAALDDRRHRYLDHQALVGAGLEVDLGRHPAEGGRLAEREMRPRRRQPACRGRRRGASLGGRRGGRRLRGRGRGGRARRGGSGLGAA
jgi:alkanesulfonate monooxygenase SsuD/methylene tetrahydromethanopterin reductase-like flavin-dependent oxidoreductase (luciferase family)